MKIYIKIVYAMMLGVMSVPISAHPVSAHNGSSSPMLKITDIYGNTMEYLLSDAPVFSMGDECVSVLLGNARHDYEVSSIENFTFDVAPNPYMNSSVGIRPTESASSALKFTGHGIEASAGETDLQLSIVGMDGTMWVYATVEAGIRKEISTAALPKGIYVVTIGDTSMKFQKS